MFLEKYRWFSYKYITEFLAKYPAYDFIREELHAVIFYDTYTLIKKYTPDKGVFYAYWKKAAFRTIDKYIKRNLRNFGTTSLDFMPSNTIHDLHDIVGREDSSYQKQLLSEVFTRIIEDKNNDFSKREQSVIKLYLDGYEMKDIAEILKCSLPSVYRNYHQAVTKIGRVLKGLYK